MFRLGKLVLKRSSLADNLLVLMENILRNRPSGVKGQFLKSAYITTTMGPSVQIDIAGISDLKVE